MPTDRQDFGKTAEKVAAEYLEMNGYQILQMNYRTPIGEIDIIAKDRETLVFVEVKARRSDQYGNPKEAVTFRKQQNIAKTALYYLKTTQQLQHKARFDVVIIRFHDGFPQIELIRNAFELRLH